MTTTRIATLTALTAFFAVTALHAQTGCSDSPENPTVVLGLVGAGGWWAAASRRRIGMLLRRTLHRDK